MYFYFLSEYPAVIKLGGIYSGTIDKTVKFFDITSPFPLVEICPLMRSGESFAFFPDEKFCAEPPQNVSVTDLKGGYLIRFSDYDVKSEFRVLEQAKYRDSVITAFVDNGCKISLETQAGFYAENLPFTPSTVEFRRGKGVNFNVIFAFFTRSNDKNALNVYDVSAPALIFSRTADEYEINGAEFTITEKIADIAKHLVKINYAFDGKKVKETGRTVSVSDKFDREKLTPAIVPYAFAEEFLCGGDYGFYLSDAIKQNADKLSGFFGEFIGVTPPPIFRDYKEVGLVKKLGERRYAVDYYLFTTENGKITDINKV
ncbi:MAG: hypothetical protein IJU83_01785 [Clostridia bacterium]|nr:hypothetical protein [Clostridia bacterium]